MDTPVKAKPKMKLYGFNNLTKTLSFNIYDICYTRTEEEKKQYIQYIDEVYFINVLNGSIQCGSFNSYFDGS